MSHVPPVLTKERSNSLGDLQVSAGQTSPSRRAAADHAATDTGFRPRTSLDSQVRPPAAAFGELDWEEAAGNAREEDGQECIRVAARFRPLSDNEKKSSEEALAVRFGADGKTCTLVLPKIHGVNEFRFSYDYIFQPDSDQIDVYNSVAKPIVESVLNGFNGAILAYGQTGSGKTHTMLGPAGAKAFVEDAEVDFESLGITPRALHDLVTHATANDGNVQLRASYVEIYNEHVIDLLSPAKSTLIVKDALPKSAAMREETQALYLPTVTETPIGSVREALEVMRTGNKNRHQAQTKMNRHSSRSHAVFVVSIVNAIDQSRQKFGQLYLVDLAGSERVLKTGVEGAQLEEAKNINKSLLALGQVIWSLAHKHKHIPYRDSKLTQLLRNCLGGNARTAVLISASPHIDNSGETLSALRFGARASLVQNAAHENIAEDAKELKRMLERAREDLNELRKHCRRLEAELVASRAAESAASSLGCADDSSSAIGAMTAKRLVVWNLLPSLVCPINRAFMRDPVVASDGWTYERRAVEKHFTKAGRLMPLSPVTGQRLSNKYLVPNLILKQIINFHLPELGPPDVQLPMIRLLHIWHVQLILGFLDSRSIARSEMAWSSFLAAADTSHIWMQRLSMDFPSSEACDSSVPPRSHYAKLKIEELKASGVALASKLGGGAASKGLKLVKPPPKTVS